MAKFYIIPKGIRMLTPFFGTIVFICLYIIATFYYPGGSQVDKYSNGFSWSNNYWCNLLNETSINGKHNPARPIAISAMVILCLSLANFWYIFPEKTATKKSIRLTIQISGALAMTISLFLFTSFHDIIIIVASLFGMLAIFGTFIILHQLQWNACFAKDHYRRLAVSPASIPFE